MFTIDYNGILRKMKPTGSRNQLVHMESIDLINVQKYVKVGMDAVKSYGYPPLQKNTNESLLLCIPRNSQLDNFLWISFKDIDTLR